MGNFSLTVSLGGLRVALRHRRWLRGVLLGRGLRGRHFGYTLRLKGQHAYINDWTVLTAASKRSI